MTKAKMGMRLTSIVTGAAMSVIGSGLVVARKDPRPRGCQTDLCDAYARCMQRQSCLTKGCYATFEASPALEGEVRHCNRSGPDGGHVHRWDGQHWQVVAGRNEHARS